MINHFFLFFLPNFFYVPGSTLITCSSLTGAAPDEEFNHSSTPSNDSSFVKSGAIR